MEFLLQHCFFFLFRYGAVRHRGRDHGNQTRARYAVQVTASSPRDIPGLVQCSSSLRQLRVRSTENPDSGEWEIGRLGIRGRIARRSPKPTGQPSPTTRTASSMYSNLFHFEGEGRERPKTNKQTKQGPRLGEPPRSTAVMPFQRPKMTVIVGHEQEYYYYYR